MLPYRWLWRRERRGCRFAPHSALASHLDHLLRGREMVEMVEMVEMGRMGSRELSSRMREASIVGQP
jgi:hypothetical protein